MAEQQPQGSHHFVITIQKPTPSGLITSTWAGAVTPPPGSTRDDVYKAIRSEYDRQYPETADGAVLFFSLEPNQL